MAIFDNAFFYKVDNRLDVANRTIYQQIAPQAKTRQTVIATPGNTTPARECYAMQARTGVQADYNLYGTTVYDASQILGDYQTGTTSPYYPGGWLPYDAPFIVHVKLARVGDIPVYPLQTGIYATLQPNPVQNAVAVWAIDTSYTPPPNGYIIESITFYDNYNDGAYSQLNPRRAFEHSADAVVWGNTAARILYTSTGELYQPGGKYGFSLRAHFKTFAHSAASYLPQGNPGSEAGRGSALHSNLVDIFRGHTVYRQYFDTSDPIPLGYRDELTVWDTLEDIKHDLNVFGVPYTFDDDAAKYDNVDDFPDYTPDGVDDNPEGGGDGDGDNISDPIIFPDAEDIYLPSTLGYLSVCLTAAEVDALTNILWTPAIKDLPSALTVLENTQPLTDTIVSLRFYPFDVEGYDAEHVESDYNLRVGWSLDDFTGGVILNGYNRVIDAGYYDLREYYGTFLDYSPHTSIDIWLPYIGYKSLPVDLVQNRRISVKYFVDFVDGLGTAVIWADDNPIALYTGALGVDIALTGRDNAAKTRQVVDNIASAVSGVARIGASIPAAVATRGAMGVGDIISGAADVGGAVAGIMYQQAPTVHFGTSGGENWLMLPQQCHLRITRAVSATPAEYIDEEGYPSTYTGKLNKFTGFVSASSVTGDFDGIPADDVQRIVDGLRAGVHIRGWS